MIQNIKKTKAQLVDELVELEESGRQYKMLFTEMPAGYALHEVICDENDLPTDYRFLEVNPAFETLTGLRATDIVGKTVLEVMPSIESEWIEKYGAVATTGESIEFEQYAGPLNRYYQVKAFRPRERQFAVLFADITEHKRTEDALLEANDRKRNAENKLAEEALHFKEHVIESASSAIATADLEGNLTYGNPSFLEAWGFDNPEDFLGKPFWKYWLVENRLEEIMQALRTDGIWAAEVQAVRTDGAMFDVQVSAAAVLDGEGNLVALTSTSIDITDRKRTEGALRITQYSVDKTAVAVYWMDPDAKFIYVNDAACSTLGYSRDELLTMTAFDISPEFPAEAWPDHWADLKERGSVLFEAVHRSQDGRVFPVEISANYLEAGDAELNIAFARDITERKRAEQQRLELERRMQHSQRVESLSVLAGGVAHDFNNLLQVILGNADLALTDLPPDAPARPRVEEIEQAGCRAAEVADQMLSFSGHGHFVLRPINLNYVVGEVCHSSMPSISMDMPLGYELDETIPDVRADGAQVKQVVVNLITNASEALASQSGGIKIITGTMMCDNAFLSDCHTSEGSSEGYYSYLEVSDTGAGMDAESVNKMFDPFFTTKFTGRGLGLAAVSGIVRGHKGAIRVLSEPGEGTTVRVLFPVVAEPGAAPNFVPAYTSLRTKGGTILLVDDESAVRDVGTRFLEQAGYDVRTAGDGIEAVEVFRKHSHEIDCVVLDLTMTKMDGEETFIELQKIRNDVPVLLSSGYRVGDVEARISTKGFAGFIKKPYRMNELKKSLREVLSRSH